MSHEVWYAIKKETKLIFFMDAKLFPLQIWLLFSISELASPHICFKVFMVQTILLEFLLSKFFYIGESLFLWHIIYYFTDFRSWANPCH